MCEDDNLIDGGSNGGEGVYEGCEGHTASERGKRLELSRPGSEPTSTEHSLWHLTPKAAGLQVWSPDQGHRVLWDVVAGSWPHLRGPHADLQVAPGDLCFCKPSGDCDARIPVRVYTRASTRTHTCTYKYGCSLVRGGLQSRFTSDSCFQTIVSIPPEP